MARAAGAGRAARVLRARWFALRAEPERGYSLLAATITLPVVFFLLMGIVQWAIVWHTRNVAQAAAQEALRTAAAYRSSAAAGQADGDSYLAQVAPHVLPHGCVHVTRTATEVRVRVHCSIVSILPFGSYAVDETAAGPVETYVNSP